MRIEDRVVLEKAHQIAVKYGLASNPEWKPKEKKENVNENNRADKRV